MENQPSNNQPKSSKKAVIFIISAIVIVTIAIWGYRGVAKKRNVTVNTNTPITNTAPASNQLYKDGTYTVINTYRAPSGPEQMGVTITLANNIVTDTNVEVKATDGDSAKYQNGFANNYKQFVVGKNINAIKLDKVAGASLTSAGFNAALADIKNQAK